MVLLAYRRMYQANSFRRPTAATSPEGGGLENEARRGCMVGASPKNISSTLRSSETMIAVPSRPSAGWNRWVKKDPFLTYAPLGDPSCANMKQKPCGFHEAPALRASVGASPKDVSSTLRSEIATNAVSSHYRWNETGGSKRIPF